MSAGGDHLACQESVLGPHLLGNPSSLGGAMNEDSLDKIRQTPEGWALEQEMEIAAEVYGPEPEGIRTDWSELSDEELVDRYKRMLGFDLKWDT